MVVGVVDSEVTDEDLTFHSSHCDDTELFSQGTALYPGGDSAPFNEVYSSPIFNM